MADKTILFVPCKGVTHVPMFKAIIDSLQNSNTRFSFHALSFDDYYHEDSEKFLTDYGIPFTRIRNFTGLPYPLTPFRPWLNLKNQYKMSQQIRRALHFTRPDLVVFANDALAGAQHVLYETKKLGIPSVLVEDSLRQNLHVNGKVGLNGFSAHAGTRIMKRILGLPENLAADYGAGKCDRLCVMGDKSRRQFIQLGVEPDKIVVTGQPRYDELFLLLNNGAMKAGKSRRKFNILYASHPFSHYGRFSAFYEDQMLKAVLQTIKELGPEYSLTIKLHPSESEHRFHHVLRKLGGDNVSTTRNLNIYDLFKECSLVVGAASTVILEAMLFKKPIITLDFSRRADSLPYSEKGAALRVQKPEKLRNAITDALFNEKLRCRIRKGQKQFLEEYVYRIDGRAAKRVTRVILELMT
ncbi:MAG: UDP-N-acetylglucosamine 2-epimerase [bacterium]